MDNGEMPNGRHHEEHKTMPIAIVGMGCRFPGDATNPEKFWDMLVEARDAWSPVPKERFNHNAFYHPDASRNGASNVRGAHFLREDLSLFDAPFFNMTAAEAAALDPQQRLLLECCFEALENGGIPMSKVAGTDTSVFVGSFCRDWSEVMMRDPDSVPMYQATGGGQALLSNRLSYFFDLHGPSVSIDTACSASLVALHLACQALRSGESKQSIVGGANVILSHELMTSMSMMRFLSPDGRSYSFDDRANGYARGEGAACLVLKPLADALSDGDPVRAVIRHSGINQDGKTAGITLPSAEAQSSLINSVYMDAKLDPGETTYVEAHGTGTQAGDPLEASALANTFSQKCARHEPLNVGSVKTNIGHLEGASGLAGVIKTVLMLEHKMILPNLNFEKPNPRIPLQRWKLAIPTRVSEWQSDGVRRASVNSFGYGGTNAHVILEEAGIEQQHPATDVPLPILESGEQTNQVKGNTPQYYAPSTSGSDTGDTQSIASLSDGSAYTPAQKMETKAVTNGIGRNLSALTGRTTRRLFCLTAFDQVAGKQQAENLLMYLRRQPDEKLSSDFFLHDLGYTLSNRRTLFAWKAAIAASSSAELIDALENKQTHFVQSNKPPKLGFCFTGQGAQWFGMGRELIHTYPVYAVSITKSSQFLREFGASWDLNDELNQTEELSRVNSADMSQPMCTAVQVALIDLLRSWGIEPLAVTGHSSGEIASAYAAGALNHESALKIAYFRGLAVSSMKAKKPNMAAGGMVAVGSSEGEIKPMLQQLKAGKAVVACYNSPNSLTVSGDESAITELQEQLEARKIFNRKLAVDTAYHSHHMVPAADEYLQGIKDLASPQNVVGVDFYSSLTASRLDVSELGPQYWVDNLLNPVRFADSLRDLCVGANSSKRTKKRTLASGNSKGAAVDVVVEIGPHSALSTYFKQIVKSEPTLANAHLTYLPTLVRGKDAVISMQALAGQLFERGYAIDIAAVNCADSFLRKPRVITDIPPYPWNHSRSHWAESTLSRRYRLRTHPRDDIVGVQVQPFNPIEPQWRNLIRPSEIPWVRDHKVEDNILYPAAGFLVMAVQASMQKAQAAQQVDIEGYELRQISIGAALTVTENGDGAGETEVFFSLRPFNENSKRSSDTWDEFRVFSCSGDNSFVEHCRGLISLKKSTKMGIASVEETIRPEANAANALSHDLNDKKLYKKLQELGLGYGPSFANVKRIKYGASKARVHITIPDTAKTMPSQFQYPYILHPATLDSCFHAMFPAMMSVTGGLKDLVLPTFIERIAISHSITREPGTELTVYAKYLGTSYNQTACSLQVYDETAGATSPAIVIDGFTTTAISNGTASLAAEKPQRRLCFYTHWDVDPDTLDPEQVITLCSTDPPSEESEQVRALEEAAFYYTERALAQLSTDRVSAMLPHHHKLYSTISHFRDLVYSESLDYPTKDWISAAEPVREALLQRVKTSGDEGRLLAHVGENLVRILTQEVEPLSVMMENDRLAKYYQNNKRMARQYDQTAKYISLLAHKNPHLRILEIGAGTGGASFPILEALGGKNTQARFLSYDYTDISSGFFEKAQQKTEAWGDLVSFKKLDIETDPSQQGFEPATYDVVLAANVLHATASVERTLTHVRQLLRPGGTLILTELTRKKPSMAVLFGILPGWWLGEEPSRQTSPLLTEDEWDASLRNTGFDGVGTAIWDTPDPVDHHGSNIISRASSESQAKPSELITIVHQGPISSELAKHVSAGLKVQAGAVKMTDLDHLEYKNLGICIVLVELDGSVLRDPSTSRYAAVQSILSSAEGLIWVTQTNAGANPDTSLAVGLARTVRTENGNTVLTTLDLDGSAPIDGSTVTKLLSRVFEQSFLSSHRNVVDLEVEYVERNGLLMIPRIKEDQELSEFTARRSGKRSPENQPFYQAGRPLRLDIGSPGLLDTLRFVDDQRMTLPLADDHVEIEVKASGINFRDVMMAMGQIEVQGLGGECCGVVSAVGKDVTRLAVGDRVVAFVDGSFANYCRWPASGVEKIPDEMPFEVGATLPIVYCTAYHSIKVANLGEGETVLIHAASGGLGQALIMLCHNVGAEVYATVGTAEKREFLRTQYGIPDDHIFSSRDESFAANVMEATGGKGVDVIFNSLSGDLLRRTFECISSFGRFIELGKKDFAVNTRLEMASFARNVTFAAVDLVTLLAEKPKYGSKIWGEIMSLVRNGVVKPPQPITTFAMSEIETALRTMQSGRHIGKLVAVPQPDDIVKAMPQKARTDLMRSDATYVLIGGLGGLGRAIAMWMVEHGARNLIFASPSGLSRSVAKDTVRMLEQKGAMVSVFSCDVSNIDQLSEVFAASQKMPPVRGIIQMAMVMRNSMFKNMSLEDWNDSLRPKVQGTWNLHNAFYQSPLDFFLMLSSSVGIIGNTSQAAYGAASTFQDSFAEYRHSLGLPATTIDLGMVVGIGYVAENEKVQQSLERQGFDSIKEEELMALLEAVFTNKSRGDAAGNIITGLGAWHEGETRPIFATLRFSHFRRMALGVKGSLGPQSNSNSLTAVRDTLRQCKSLGQATRVTCEAIMAKMSALLMVSLEEISQDRSMQEYGMDSLVAVEMRNWISSNLGATVPVLDIVGNTSLNALSLGIIKKSTFIDTAGWEEVHGED